MATRTDRPKASGAESLADQIFKKLTDEAGVQTASGPSELEGTLEKLRIAIEAFSAASGEGKSPQWLTDKLEQRLSSLNETVAMLYGKGIVVSSPNDEDKPIPLADTVSIREDKSPSQTPPPQSTNAATNPAATGSGIYGFADPTDRMESGPVYDVKPPEPRPEKPPEERKTSSVPAFDRPIPVIIMGPRPVPVSITGAGAGSSGSSRETPDKSSFNFQNITAGIQLLATGMSSLSHTLRTAAVTTDALIDVTGAYVGAIGKINNAVEAFDPGTAYLFSDAAKNLEAAIGRLLVPAVKQATVVINFINVALSKLGGDSKVMISALAGAGAIMTALAVAVAATTAMFFALAGAIGAVGVAINIATAGIPAILGAVASAMAAVGIAGAAGAAGLAVFTSLTADTAKLLAALTPIMNAFIGSLERMSPRLLAIGERIAPVVIQIVEFVAVLTEMAVAIAAVPGVLEAVGIAALIALAPLILLISPLILLAVAASAAVVAIYTLLRALGLIEAIKVGDKKGDKTIAASPATFGSAQSMAEKSYAAAYSLGTGDKDDPMSNLNNSIVTLTTGVNNLSTWVENQVKEVEKWIVEADKWINKIENFGNVITAAAKALIPDMPKVPDMPTKNEFRGFAESMIPVIPIARGALNSLRRGGK